MASTTAPETTAENANITPGNDKPKRAKILWIIVLVAVVVILAAIGGGVAAHYLLLDKISDQVVQTDTGDGLSGKISTGADGSESANSAIVQTDTLVIPVTTNGSVSQSMLTTTRSVPGNIPTTAMTTTPTMTTTQPFVSNSATTVMIITETGDGAVATPTSAAINPCGNTLAFTTSVSWAGVASPINPSQVLWLYNLPNGKSCCDECWAMSPQKCNVWGYFPLGHPVDEKVSCALVYDYPGPQVDGSCPAGRPQVGIVPAGPDNPYDASGNVGGPGPCAGLIYSVL